MAMSLLLTPASTQASNDNEDRVYIFIEPLTNLS